MFGLSAIPAVIQGIGMYFLPMSPRFLMLKKKEEAASKVLKKLRGTSTVDKEISGIRVSLASEEVKYLVSFCSLELKKNQTTCICFAYLIHLSWNLNYMKARIASYLLL